ncbi:hypothetical protein [Pyxidicoccus xibeiensis]|uniref:hypothetical protein n=1 Tax=Pyxidicoccus xibeiensis TaxID=2906759 RepID=UPI0020A7CD42|nr:hypothetical protein [Pyxidicoccus xibeiensis]MCP3136942.1 hypothetical protein [Pyxidicoccus xibeiensis]
MSPTSTATASDSPSVTTPDSAPAPERFTVHAASPLLRGIGVAARGGMLGCLLFFSGWLVLDALLPGEYPLPPGPLVWGLGLGVPLPWLLSTVLRWSTRATAEVDGAHLVLTLRSRARLEIPYEAVESVRPWRLPLPGPGLSLLMKSGRAFGYGLELEDPVPLLTALGRHVPRLETARAHPLMRYAQVRHAFWRRRWYHFVGKLVLFPMLPTGIFFQLSQRITYGSPFGEYQSYGLAAWLRSFGRDYAQVFVNFLLVACFLRALVEGVSFAAAWLTPSYARGVRRGAEWLNRFAYYVVLLALLALRILVGY